MIAGIECWENGMTGEEVEGEHPCDHLEMRAGRKERLWHVVCYRAGDEPERLDLEERKGSEICS